MSRSDAWMPLYVADYLGDTGHLRMGAHGAYLLLMMHYWRTGPLPDDDAALAAIARASDREWKAVAGQVRAFFAPDGGKLRHKRVDAEKARAERLSAKRSAAASARWDREQPGCAADAKHEDSNCNANASRLDKPGTSPSPSPSKEEGSVLRTGAAGASRGVSLFADLPERHADARADLFRDGATILRTLTGKSETQCRGQIGQWLKITRDDCAGLLTALREADALRPADPMAWLTAAVRRRADGREKPGRASWAVDRMREMAGHE